MAVPLLDVQSLTARFPTREGVVHAVNGVSFHLDPGETLALVGESGSGKSVVALSILGLLREPPASIGGRILFRGEDLRARSERALESIRGSAVAMVFQEPMTALNPVMTVSAQIVEAIRIHTRRSPAAARARATALLALVGIAAPAATGERYPHELSGGMRQRVMIAMALAADPALLVADEPTTALDVTVQAGILDLLARLRAEIGLSVLLITHDLGVAAEIADRVAVIYAGRIVETGRTEELFARPLHPYTQGLLASRPRLGRESERLPAIPGAVPDPVALPRGCAFHPRCPLADLRCGSEEPVSIAAAERTVACFHAGETAFAPLAAPAPRERP